MQNNKLFTRRDLMVAAAALALIAGMPFSADAEANYPTKPIKLIVPFTPSGGSDTVARIAAPKISEILGQPVVVENRPGGDTIVGSDIVAKAKPDGYTLLLGSTSFGINPALKPSMPYDTLEDFEPIGHITYLPYVIVVPAESPARSLKELVELSKKAPKEKTLAVAGLGNHLASELFDSQVGTDPVKVRYKGAAPALLDLIPGRVDYMFATIPSVLPQIRAGQLRALATTGLNRSVVLPETPTVIEAGYEGYQAGGWNGILAPAGIDDAVAAKLSEAVRQTAEDAAIIEQLAASGSEAVQGSDREQFKKFLNGEINKWVELSKRRKIDAE